MDYQAWNELLTGLVTHCERTGKRWPARVLEELDDLGRALTDLQVRVTLLYTAQSDCLITWEVEGIHAAEYRGLWPSHLRVKASGLATLHAEGGVVTDARFHLSLESVDWLLRLYLPTEDV